jgi:ribosomal-protein-alanine N-acetyltransferase
VTGVAPTRLETERMVGRRLALEDLDELVSLYQDERVARTLFPHRDPPTRDETKVHILQKNEHWDRYGFGAYAMWDRETNQFVARVGLQHTLSTGADEIELMWAVVPERWGEGLATEFANAGAALAFDVLELADVIAYTLVTNVASRRVMEKAGLSEEREFEHVALPHVLYRRRRC